MRDIKLEDTIYMDFTTRAFATGIPTVLTGSQALSVLEENNATPITAGVSVAVDRASVVGLNMATIVATAANGYAAGSGYTVYISTGTVGGVSVVGEAVGHFTIEANPVNWARVTAPTTAVDLSGTDIQLVDTTTTNTDLVTAAAVNTAVEAGQVGTDATEILADVTGIAGAAMRGTDSAALASVVGALADAAAVGDVTSADTIMQYVKQLLNELSGSVGIGTMPTLLDPANGVNLFEMVRAGMGATFASSTDSLEQLQADHVSIQSDTDDLQTQIGTAGAGLTDLGGMSTGMKNEVESEAQDALVALRLDHLVATADGDDPVDGSIMAHLASATEDWSTFVPSTDSLEAIRVEGDASWGAAGSGLLGIGIQYFVRQKDATSQTIDIFIADTATGEGQTGLAFGSGGEQTSYRKGPTAARADVTLATQTVGGAWSSGGFVEIDATNMPGWYRLDILDAMLDTETPVSGAIQFTDSLAVFIISVVDYDPTAAPPAVPDVNVASMDADTLTASALAADAVTEIQTGLGTDTAQTNIQTAVDDTNSIVDQLLRGLILIDTDIATLASQTSFTITIGPPDDDTLNKSLAVFQDFTTSAQKGRALVQDYAQSTKTVTLREAPDFTIAITDLVTFVAISPDLYDVLADTADMQPKLGTPVTDLAADIAVIEAQTDDIGVAGAGLTAINLPNQTMDIVGDITGNLSGSVGSVTGAVTVGTINVDVVDAVALAADAVQEIVDGVWDELRASHITIDTFGASHYGFIEGLAQTGTLSTTVMTTNLTEATDDHFIGRTIVFLGGVLHGQATDVTDYSGTNGTLTYSTITEAPLNNQRFILV